MKLSFYILIIFTLILFACQSEKEPELLDFVGDWYAVNYSDAEGNPLDYPYYSEFTFLEDRSIRMYHDDVGILPHYYKESYEKLNLEMIGDSMAFEITWKGDTTYSHGKYYHRMPKHYTYCLSHLNTDTTFQGINKFSSLTGTAEIIRSYLKGQPATYKEIQSLWNLEVLKEEEFHEEHDQLFKDYASDFNK